MRVITEKIVLGIIIKLSFYFLYIILLFANHYSWAKQGITDSTAIVFSDERQSIEMVAGLPKPPFIIDENGAGLQLDLIRQAFTSVNYSVNFSHVPAGRSITSFKRFNADGITLLPQDYNYPSIYVSKPYISYQNVAVSLADNNFIIDQVTGLKGKSIIAFQNAKKFMGSEYNTSVGYASTYREFSDQIKQINMLFSRRIEVIILDVSIFKHFIKSHVGGRYDQIFNIHYIFEERDYAAGFRNKAYRDLFDSGIINIKEQGIYQQVIERYM